MPTKFISNSFYMQRYCHHETVCPNIRPFIVLRCRQFSGVAASLHPRSLRSRVIARILSTRATHTSTVITARKRVGSRRNGRIVACAVVANDTADAVAIGPIAPIAGANLDTLGVPEVEVAAKVPNSLRRQSFEVAVRSDFAGSLDAPTDKNGRTQWWEKQGKRREGDQSR